MAIKVTSDNSDPKDPKLKLEINNGDLRALRDVLARTGFVNEQALLRYALVALLQAEDDRIYIKQGGETVIMEPNKNLLLKPDKKP